MPDEKGDHLADEGEVPDTPLHAHGDGREDDVEGTTSPEVGEEGDLDEKGPGNPVGDDSGGAKDEEE